MTIKRTINGQEIEIELTEKEMNEVFVACQLRNDIDEINYFLEEVEREDGENKYNMTDEDKKEAALAYRDAINTTECESYWETIKWILRDYEEE